MSVGGNGAVAVVGDVEGSLVIGADVAADCPGALVLVEVVGAGEPEASLASSAFNAMALMYDQLEILYLHDANH